MFLFLLLMRGCVGSGNTWTEGQIASRIYIWREMFGLCGYLMYQYLLYYIH